MKIFKGITFAGQASAPSSPANGDVYYDSTLNKLRCYQNGVWVNLSDSDGTVLLEDGSVGAPSLAFTDDTSTGLWSSANGFLSVATTGRDTASFSSDGSNNRWMQFNIPSTGRGIIFNQQADGDLIISGGGSSGNGGNLAMYGGSHASKANDWELRSASTIRMNWDASANLISSFVPFTVNGDGSNAGLSVSSANLITLGASGSTQDHIVRGSSLAINAATSGTTTFLTLQKAGTNYGVLAVAGAVGSIVTDSAAGDIILEKAGGGDLRFSGGSNVTGLLISSANLITIGASGGTQNHLVNGNLNIAAQGELRLQDTTGGQYVGHRAPGTVGSSHTYTWPTALPGSNQILQSDSSGNLSWVAASGGGDVLNGGNSFGGAMTIGTNDTFGLNFETDATTAGSISSAGSWTIGRNNSASSHTINGYLALDYSTTGEGYIQPSVSDQFMSISGDIGSGSGRNMFLYGASHATLANVFRIRNGTTVHFEITNPGVVLLGAVNGTQYHSVRGSGLSMTTGTATTADFEVYRDTTAGSLFLEGGSGSANSAQIRLYGQTHASLANVTRFTIANTVHGSISGSGLWTLGASSSTNEHVMNGNGFRLTTNADTTGYIIADNDNAGSSAGSSFVANTSGGGDAWTNWSLEGGQDFSMGIDNSASDALKITTGTSPSAGTTFFELSTAGQFTIGASGGTQVHAVNGSINATGQGIFAGTTTNDDAAAGDVGELVGANPGASVTPAASGSRVDVTSISLTAGDWDVEGWVQVIPGTISGWTRLSGNVSLTSAGADDATKGGFAQMASPAVSATTHMPLGVRRISIASTTTVYLTARIDYSSLGTAVYGTDSYLRARRVR